MESNPYAPSESTLKGALQVAREESRGFRDLSGISGKLSMLLLLGAGWKILGLVSSLMQMHLLSSGPYSLAQANANDLRERLVNLGQLLLYLITAVVLGRWIYLAHKNLPELGARHLRFTPGWSVGSFFIPVVSLWAPYQAMRDLAKASRDPRTWELEDTPPLIVIWWILWLVVEVFGNGVFRLAMGARTVQQLKELTVLHMASGVLSVPLYFLARYIVRRVWRDQSQNYAQVTNVSLA